MDCLLCTDILDPSFSLSALCPPCRSKRNKICYSILYGLGWSDTPYNLFLNGMQCTCTVKKLLVLCLARHTIIPWYLPADWSWVLFCWINLDGTCQPMKLWIENKIEKNTLSNIITVAKIKVALWAIIRSLKGESDYNFRVPSCYTMCKNSAFLLFPEDKS